MRAHNDVLRLARGRAAWYCMDCSTDTYESEEFYMLHRGLWKSINPQVDGMLCLACVERRLKRGLRRADFTGAPVNASQANICPALATRLKREQLPAVRRSFKARQKA